MSTPFENNVEVFDLKGEHIMELLEFSVANDPYPGARMLQVSGNFLDAFENNHMKEAKTGIFHEILASYLDFMNDFHMF